MMGNTKFSMAIIVSFLAVAGVNADQAGPSFKSGMYTGLLFGYSNLHASNKETVNVGIQPTETKTVTANQAGLVGNLLIGYRELFKNNFLLGGELGISLDNSQMVQKNILGNNIHSSYTKLGSVYKFVPALVLGGKFSDKWLGFVKMGPSISQFKVNHSITQVGFSPLPGAINKFRTTKVGFMAAVGAEYAVDEDVSTVGIVSYEKFGSINRTFGVVDGVAGEKDTINLKPQYVTATVGMVYKF